MRKAKYIVGQVSSGLISNTVALIFPDAINHDTMARKCVDGGPSEVLGAGFFYIENDTVHVYGRSSSLGVASRQEDVQFISGALCLAVPSA